MQYINAGRKLPAILAKGFAIIDQAIPDARILDLMMPDVDGFKVLEILRYTQSTAHIPVLILRSKIIDLIMNTLFEKSNREADVLESLLTLGLKCHKIKYRMTNSCAYNLFGGTQ